MGRPPVRSPVVERHENKPALREQYVQVVEVEAEAESANAQVLKFFFLFFSKRVRRSGTGGRLDI